MGDFRDGATMSRLAKEIEEQYLRGVEQLRLSADEGELERHRTQSILVRYLPAARPPFWTSAARPGSMPSRWSRWLTKYI
jgi:hypothetical protein